MGQTRCEAPLSLPELEHECWVGEGKHLQSESSLTRVLGQDSALVVFIL